MSKSKKTTSTTITQPELIEQLCAAGHELHSFSRKGDNLIVRLTPANLSNDAEGFVALDICDAAGLQASCSVFSAAPENLLVVTVKLPESTAGGPPFSSDACAAGGSSAMAEESDPVTEPVTDDAE